MSRYFHYFVEGEDEAALLKTLKTDFQLILPGKIQVFNVIERKLNAARLMSLKPDTTVILVYDTDTENIAMLRENIQFIRKQSAVKEVLCIPQVRNLEDELLRSCKIREIKELTGSKSNKEYKRDLIRHSQMSGALQRHGFDFSKFWDRLPANRFQTFGNDACKVKKSKIHDD